MNVLCLLLVCCFLIYNIISEWTKKDCSTLKLLMYIVVTFLLVFIF